MIDTKCELTIARTMLSAKVKVVLSQRAGNSISVKRHFGHTLNEKSQRNSVSL